MGGVDNEGLTAPAEGAAGLNEKGPRRALVGADVARF